MHVLSACRVRVPEIGTEHAKWQQEQDACPRATYLLVEEADIAEQSCKDNVQEIVFLTEGPDSTSKGLLLFDFAPLPAWAMAVTSSEARKKKDTY